MENANSPYYMGNRDLLPVVFETEYNGIVITQELPWDVGGEDLVHSLYVALRSYFGHDSAVHVMTGYVKNERELLDVKTRLVNDFRLTVKTNDRVFTMTLNSRQLDGYNIMEAFHSACIALTFQENTIKDMIGNYLVDCLGQEQLNNE